MKRFNGILTGVFLCALVVICSAQMYERGFEVVRNIITDKDTGKTAQVEANGGLAVNVQDQHTLALDLKFIQSQGATTLAVTNAPGDTTLTLTDATGFVDGNVIGLFSASGTFYFGEQVGAAVGNVITIDTPMDRIYEVGDNVLRATANLAVDGSGTTQVFQVGPVGAGTGVEIDITRIMGYIQDATAMDDGEFGGLGVPLTYGVVLRVNNGVMSNIWNVKSNGEIGLLAFDANYTDKAPGGSYGYRFRNTYAGQSKHGVTIRLEPGDTLEILIQDDLSDLEIFNIMAQGHVVTD